VASDKTYGNGAAPRRNGWLLGRLVSALSKLLRGVRGLSGGRRNDRDLSSMNEELFRVRGEMSLARSELERIRAVAGRSDVFHSPEEMLRAGPRREIEAIVRGRCRAVPMAGGRMLCRVLGRYKFYVDQEDLVHGAHLLTDGFWEYWITEFVCRNVHRGEVALDVGAGYGYYAPLLADLVGPDGVVHAFEANPRLAQLLRETVALNGLGGRIIPHEVAVGREAGEPAMLRAPIADPATGSVLFGAGNVPEPEPGLLAVPVPQFPLDRLADRPVHFAKIDVTGAEGAVWAGMQKLLERNPQIRLLLQFGAYRHAEPALLLARFAQAFPLRLVEPTGRARPCTVSEVLASEGDTMLYLARSEPR
jgi:FkbM family methyltransferase